jgi:hypothetical protein
MTSAVTVPVILCGLALLDAAFAGFRSSTGRDAGLVDHRYNLVAAGWGIGVGILGLVVIAACTVPWLLRESSRSDNYQSMLTAGTRMLVVYLPMATLNLLAISLYLLATSHEVRAVAMTLVLGPFTLLRPPVIAAGALWASWGSGFAAVWFGALVAAVVTIGVGPAVGWLRFREFAFEPSLHKSGS